MPFKEWDAFQTFVPDQKDNGKSQAFYFAYPPNFWKYLRFSD
jgi:hypothetical protein